MGRRDDIQIYTIGFTQKSAEEFFALLRKSGAKRIIDVRLNNVSQLAGFAKKDDLKFFAHEVAGLDYVHLPELAPTPELFDAFKRKQGDWKVFEAAFLKLMAARRIEKTVDQEMIRGGCLLCSEALPHHCHRRLVADYLKDKWSSNVEVTHLT